MQCCNKILEAMIIIKMDFFLNGLTYTHTHTCTNVTRIPDLSLTNTTMKKAPIELVSYQICIGQLIYTNQINTTPRDKQISKQFEK